jgi:hypothetical protein
MKFLLLVFSFVVTSVLAYPAPGNPPSPGRMTGPIYTMPRVQKSDTVAPQAAQGHVKPAESHPDHPTPGSHNSQEGQI